MPKSLRLPSLLRSRGALGPLRLLSSQRPLRRCHPRDGAPPWNTHRYVVRYVEHPVGAWDIADARDIAVRTRGVFTHRAVFQKPACAERGLVRTASQPVSVNYGN